MKSIKFCWFVRYSYTKEGKVEIGSGIIEGEEAKNAFNSFAQYLADKHDISRSDIDIISFNRV